ncbi:hypothetical protein [Colwellia echini]|uniref:Flagellar protein FliT n=1 Tax=Colwellia echini TaxID=1982103 RepID=A0ABY3MWM1_9GAMM|nr:hypothetical protein [Colwellia echini]TYK65603.1 hypothetical protein CWS31_009575 [Colwellia echini]
MSLKVKLNSIIQLSQDELSLLNEDELDLALLTKIEADRFLEIKNLFEVFPKAELAIESDLLAQIKELDQQLTINVLERQKSITKTLSEFRNNKKASKAYNNI